MSRIPCPHRCRDRRPLDAASRGRLGALLGKGPWYRVARELQSAEHTLAAAVSGLPMVAKTAERLEKKILEVAAARAQKGGRP